MCRNAEAGYTTAVASSFYLFLFKRRYPVLFCKLNLNNVGSSALCAFSPVFDTAQEAEYDEQKVSVSDKAKERNTKNRRKRSRRWRSENAFSGRMLLGDSPDDQLRVREDRPRKGLGMRSSMGSERPVIYTCSFSAVSFVSQNFASCFSRKC